MNKLQNDLCLWLVRCFVTHHLLIDSLLIDTLQIEEIAHILTAPKENQPFHINARLSMYELGFDYLNPTPIG